MALASALSIVRQVRRGVTAREEYEKVAREIRFNAYKDALAGRDCQAVMFGHHEGDVEENVLTNFVKGCSILELAGGWVSRSREKSAPEPVCFQN